MRPEGECIGQEAPAEQGDRDCRDWVEGTAALPGSIKSEGIFKASEKSAGFFCSSRWTLRLLENVIMWIITQVKP